MNRTVPPWSSTPAPTPGPFYSDVKFSLAVDRLLADGGCGNALISRRGQNVMSMARHVNHAAVRRSASPTRGADGLWVIGRRQNRQSVMHGSTLGPPRRPEKRVDRRSDLADGGEAGPDLQL